MWRVVWFCFQGGLFSSGVGVLECSGVGVFERGAVLVWPGAVLFDVSCGAVLMWGCSRAVPYTLLMLLSDSSLALPSNAVSLMYFFTAAV